MHRRHRRAPARPAHRQHRPRHRLALLSDLACDAVAGAGLCVELERHVGGGQLADPLRRAAAPDQRDLVAGARRASPPPAAAAGPPRAARSGSRSRRAAASSTVALMPLATAPPRSGRVRQELGVAARHRLDREQPLLPLAAGRAQLLGARPCRGPEPTRAAAISDGRSGGDQEAGLAVRTSLGHAADAGGDHRPAQRTSPPAADIGSASTALVRHTTSAACMMSRASAAVAQHAHGAARCRRRRAPTAARPGPSPTTRPLHGRVDGMRCCNLLDECDCPLLRAQRRHQHRQEGIPGDAELRSAPHRDRAPAGRWQRRSGSPGSRHGR